MASSEDDPSKLLESMFSDEKYKACYELYKDAEEALEESDLDMLEKLTLQYHVMKDTPVSLTEVLHRRMEALKEGNHELRVYIAGEVAVGKTTFMNLLMGGSYLPTDHGSCTNVLCEVHNNPSRFGGIYYETEDPAEVHLSPNWDSEEWERIKACITSKMDNSRTVTKVRIFWPIDIFKSYHHTEPKDTGRSHSGSLEYGSDEVGMLKGKLPIIFMDFPGVDPDHKELFQPYIKYTDRCHTFIFVIDAHRDHGVHGPTLQKLMTDIADAIALENTTLDPENALFICTNCPQKLMKDKEKLLELTEKVLNRIQMCWPMVVRNQILFLDDMEQISKSPDRSSLMNLQKGLVNFLVKSERLLLEEHCMWLMGLLECTSAYLKFGNKWKSLEDVTRVDTRTRELIEGLIRFHDDLTSNSSTIQEIEDIQKQYEDRIRRYLDHEITLKELTISDVSLIGDRIGRGLNSFQEACDKEIEIVIEKLRDNIQNTLLYGGIKKIEDNTENDSLFLKMLSVSLMAVFLWPIGLSVAAIAIFEFVKSIKEHDVISKETLIKKVVATIKENIKAKLTKILIEVNRQRRDLVEILDQNKKNKLLTTRSDKTNVSQRFDDIARRLWDVYVGQVMEHDFSQEEITVYYEKSHSGKPVYDAEIKSRKNEYFVVKEVQTILRGRSGRDFAGRESEKDMDNNSILYDSSIFRERYILRHLSMKKADEDHKYFVQYEGSAERVDNNHYYLQLIMKKYKHSLQWIVINEKLTDEKKAKYAKAAARGLRFVHKHRVMHRDVKLSNYLVDDDDNVVISDVGHSKHTDGVQTIRGRGTLLYLAPELRDFSHPHSTASDIYSFGLMLWELYHGKLIENVIFIDQRVLKKTEDKLDILVRKCLNKNAQQRPSIRDIVVRLDNIFP